jgi:Fe-S cluster assembly protein SufD
MSNQQSTILDVLQQQFTELEGQLNGTTNSAAHLARKSSFEAFKKAGLPDRKSEEYKYTPLSKQFEKSFAGFVANKELKDTKLSEKIPALDGSTIVFVNGKFDETLSKVEKQDEARIKIASAPKDLLSGESNDESSADVFAGLNLALASSGVKIDIEKGVVAPEPINIIHLSDTSAGKVLSTPRHEISIGENAQATITEIFIGGGDDSSFTNSALEITLGSHGILNHYKIGIDGDNDLRIDNTTIIQQHNSVLNTLTVNYGGKIVRNNLSVILAGEHSETNLDGLFIPISEGNIDNHTVVDHKMPNCNSNELYKGIIGENATGVFNGKVFVRPDAQKTNAFQSNKNILLADTATINSKPQLEIWADDVKCSHGSTTGQMDKEQLFYLRARGIDVHSARKLLLKAFTEEVIKKIKDDKLRARVAAILEEKLDN